MTTLFEELAGAIVVEAQRLFRNATAGMWFEGVPSLRDLKLHKERADKTPQHEIADYIDPEPSSTRVSSVLIGRIEPLRKDVTTAALRLRVERLTDPTQADVAVPTETEASTSECRQPMSPTGKAVDRRGLIDTFLARCRQETQLKVNRTHIWRAVGHSSPRQFEYWQAGQDRTPGSNRGATAQDDQNFSRILAMNPADFETLLKKQGIN